MCSRANPRLQRCTAHATPLHPSWNTEWKSKLTLDAYLCHQPYRCMSPYLAVPVTRCQLLECGTGDARQLHLNEALTAAHETQKQGAETVCRIGSTPDAKHCRQIKARQCSRQNIFKLERSAHCAQFQRAGIRSPNRLARGCVVSVMNLDPLDRFYGGVVRPCTCAFLDLSISAAVS
jgi:hypothetical protein